MARNRSPKVITKKHRARMEREQIQNRYITIIAAVVVVLVVGLVAFSVLDQTVLQKYKTVAKVGSDKITVEQFQKEVRWQRTQLINQYNQYYQLSQYFGSSDTSGSSYFESYLTQIQSELENTETLGQNVLDSMVEDLLIRQECAKRGITVTEQEIDTELQNQLGYYPNGTPTPTLTPTPFATSTLSPTQLALVPPTSTPTPAPTETMTPTATVDTSVTAAPTAAPTEVQSTPTAGPTSTITPTATPYTYEGYQQVLKDTVTKYSDIGFTEADIRHLIESNLYYTKLLDAYKAEIDPQQDQVWARHILVADEATAQSIIDQLKNGGDFAALAAQYSTDTSNASKGGDLGWFSYGDMVKEFSDAAFALGIGEISAPVQTTYGWHVIQVLGHETRTLTTDEIDTKAQTNLTNWLTEAKAADTVQEYDVWKDYVPTDPVLTTASSSSGY